MPYKVGATGLTLAGSKVRGTSSLTTDITVTVPQIFRKRLGHRAFRNSAVCLELAGSVLIQRLVIGRRVLEETEKGTTIRTVSACDTDTQSHHLLRT